MNLKELTNKKGHNKVQIIQSNNYLKLKHNNKNFFKIKIKNKIKFKIKFKIKIKFSKASLIFNNFNHHPFNNAIHYLIHQLNIRKLKRKVVFHK